MPRAEAEFTHIGGPEARRIVKPLPGGRADLKALERVIARDAGLDTQMRAQAFMNYASAPLGAKKYDASMLATSSTGFTASP